MKAIKYLASCVAVIAGLLAAAFMAHQVSPWPSALVFRHAMDSGGVGSAAGMAKHVPPGVTSRLDQRYVAPGSDTTFDLHLPSSVAADRPLTIIVWIHGGGFISGDKSQIANYLKILAGNGYAVAGINYDLAPGRQYPGPVLQANAALAHLAAQAARLNIDPARFIVAGDSAGAQIAAQLAAALSAPAYANAVGIVPAIPRTSLIATILHCGIYDFTMVNVDGPLGRFLRSAGWSYFGAKDFISLPAVGQASVTRHVTENFPPAFISAGNADPLLPHSLALADALTAKGVPVDRLFFPADYKPALSHEYQFNLDTEAGKLALQRTLKFLAAL